MLIGASWPWNLSTVPTRASGGQQPLDRADLGVVRRDDQDVRPSRPAGCTPCRSTQRGAALDEGPGESPRPASASIGDSLSAPIGRRPRSAAARRRRDRRPATSRRWIDEMRLGLQPVVVEDLGRERAEGRVEPPGASPGTGRGRAASSRGRRGRGPAPTGPPRADACPAAAGRAAADRRAGRGCSVERAHRRRRSPARSGPPRRRTGRRPRPTSSPRPTARTCRRRGWLVRRRAAPARRRRPSHASTAGSIDDLVLSARAGSARTSPVDRRGRQHLAGAGCR